jgi:hypothetical protein
LTKTRIWNGQFDTTEFPIEKEHQARIDPALPGLGRAAAFFLFGNSRPTTIDRL